MDFDLSVVLACLLADSFKFPFLHSGAYFAPCSYNFLHFPQSNTGELKITIEG